MQFFGDSREKMLFPPSSRPPPLRLPPLPRQKDRYGLSQRCSRSVAPPKASWRGGAPVPGGAHPVLPGRAAPAAAPSRRGPVPAPRQHRTPRLGGLSDSAGSAADPDFRAYKSASSSPILSSPAPGSLCNHSKTPGVESKPQWAV